MDRRTPLGNDVTNVIGPGRGCARKRTRQESNSEDIDAHDDPIEPNLQAEVQENSSPILPDRDELQENSRSNLPDRDGSSTQQTTLQNKYKRKYERRKASGSIRKYSDLSEQEKEKIRQARKDRYQRNKSKAGFTSLEVLANDSIVEDIRDENKGTDNDTLHDQGVPHKKSRTKYADLSEEAKEKIRQANRARYHRKKAEASNTKLVLPATDGIETANNDWLHRNNTYTRQQMNTATVINTSRQSVINASGQSVITNVSLLRSATATTCEHPGVPTQCPPLFESRASEIIDILSRPDTTIDANANRITIRGTITRSAANELSSRFKPQFESPASEIIDLLSRPDTTSDANDFIEAGNNITPHRPVTRSVANGSNNTQGIKPTFDSGIWEPDDPQFGAYEEDLDCNEPDNCIDDIYDDEEARAFNIKDVVYETRRDPDVPVIVNDPYDFVYKDLPKQHHVLKKVPNCQYCGAVKFPGEGEAFCCRKGKVNIFIPEVPQRLRELFTSQSDKTAIYFRKNIRYFNSHFSFTSFGASIDRRLATAAGTGVYTFKVHGQIYHKLDGLVPGAKGPRHMQLYFYDTDETLGHRTTRSPHLDVDVIREVLDILTHTNNPYVLTFKSLGQLENLDKYTIELNTSISVDQRRYNAPAMEQVAAIWVDGNDASRRFTRSILIYGNSGRPRYIRAYHGCYDPLAYPLFYPGGETGWEDKKILLEDPPIVRFPRQKRKYTKKEKTGSETPKTSDSVRGRKSKTVNKPNSVGVQLAGCQARSIQHDIDGDYDDENGEPDDDDGNGGSRLHVSAREYYCYLMQMRSGVFVIFFYGGRLFQQWIVDVYVKVESMRLDWHSKPENQKTIRADLYQGIVDTLAVGEARASQAGKRIVLNKSFPGCDRDIQARFMDGMALVAHYGRPDYFITMTCNPYWPEITEQLLPGQTAQDRPDIVARVYRAKLLDLQDLLIKKKHFGQVAAWAHVTEFQKRGLPHEHFLLIMDKHAKLGGPDDYDKHISAELPDEKKYPLLHSLVVRHMMHGPCGVLNPKCPCMIDGTCRFKYPRQYSETTQQGRDAYPVYRRREDGQKVLIRGKWLDNRWVVPYNPKLLMRYNCHINVEICSSIKSVKYLYKYIHKGHDCASFSVGSDQSADEEVNEIKQYRNARCITAIEAVYRLYRFPMYSMSPPVLQMQVHLPGMHMVPFNERENLEDVERRARSQKSMLTDFFRMNVEDENAPKYLYREFPEHYTWNKSGKFWKARTRTNVFQIGRLVFANPAEGERYYLRILLNHVRGATSYAFLRTVRGSVCPTFRNACEVLGLVETDKSLDDALVEATSFKMPCALRRLFATIIVFCECTDILGLWEKHWQSMAEDYIHSGGNPTSAMQCVLRDIADIVAAMGKDIRNYGLPKIDAQDDPSRDYYRELTEERKIGFEEADLNIIDTLNAEQKAGFSLIIDAVVSQRGRVFFVDGPGGTGKTYLYRALLAKVRSMNLIAVATATSGIAASIMPGGRTAHSRFKIPIKFAENNVCGFSKQSGTAVLLRTASLIIWDEVAMTRRQAVETLDRSLQDIMDCTDPFGGKVVVFGGDFRQVLPVVPRGTRAQITDATLQRSYIWDKITKISLKQNMRAQTDVWFSEFLLRIGNGTEQTYGNDYVQLPDDIIIEYTDDKSVDKLIQSVFPNLAQNYNNSVYMRERAILSTRNEHVDGLNARMIDLFPGREKVYFSHDSVEDDSNNNYPLDFLNSITPNGLPPHELRVKKNCPVILLRNLDPHSGLCNGTRLVVRGFEDNAIDAEIVNGQHAGKRVFIPRIPLSPSEDISLPFKFKRKQFPIRLSFAMTINKAQGQTIPNVGVYLPDPVFSHGQLYVALSRGVSCDSTWVLAKPNKDVDPTGKRTKNIVYRDVLEA